MAEYLTMNRNPEFLRSGHQILIEVSKKGDSDAGTYNIRIANIDDFYFEKLLKLVQNLKSKS